MQKSGDFEEPRTIGMYTKTGFIPSLIDVDPTNLFRLNANILPTA